MTLGGSSKDYHFRGKHRNHVETFLKPEQLFAQYCGHIYLPPVYSYNMSASIEVDRVTIAQRAAAHADRILEVITSLQPEVDSNTAIAYNQTFSKNTK